MGSENYKGWSMTLEAYLEMEEIWEVVEKGPDSSDEVCPSNVNWVKFIKNNLFAGLSSG